MEVFRDALTCTNVKLVNQMHVAPTAHGTKSGTRSKRSSSSSLRSLSWLTKWKKY